MFLAHRQNERKFFKNPYFKFCMKSAFKSSNPGHGTKIDLLQFIVSGQMLKILLSTLYSNILDYYGAVW